jgi:hypothetical protein
MPTLKGTFTADFDSFSRAVEAADVQLKAFEADSNKVETSLSRMVNTFTGQKVVSEATLMAEAVERIGGASKLTEAELARVSSVAQEAAEKLRAVGRDVPANIQALADATKGANAETQSWTQSIVSWGQSMVSQVTIANLLTEAITTVARSAKDLAVGFAEMVVHGSDVADVSENFARLTDQAGLLSTTLLGTLREGTHNTISDFDLMKTANGALAAGMNLTDAQFKTLAQGAFALSNATGVNVKVAFDQMVEAMVKGRAQSLASLTGKIDLTKAEDDFAAAMGRTGKELSDEGKLQADRLAMLNAVSTTIGRLGQQTDGLDENVQQVNTSWGNFVNKLGESLAKSEALETAIAGVRDIFLKTFGATQEEAIARIRKGFDDLVVGAIEFGKVIVQVAGFGVTEWYAFDKVIGDTMQVIDGVRLAFLYFNLEVGKARSWTTGIFDETLTTQIRDTDNAINALMLSMKARGERLQEDDAKQKQVTATTAGYVAQLDALKGKVEGAVAGSTALAGANTTTAATTEAAATAMGQLGKNTGDAALFTNTLSDAEKAYQKVMDEIHNTTHKLALAHEKEWRDEIEKTKNARNKATVEALETTAKAENELHDLEMKNALDSTDYQITKAWEVADAKVAAFAKSGDRSEAEMKRYADIVYGIATETAQALRDTADAAAESTERSAARQTTAIKQVTQSYWDQIDAAARAAGVTVVGQRPGEPGTGVNQGVQVPFGGTTPPNYQTSTISGGGSFSASGGGETDPRVLAYTAVGYTLGEAMALVGGYGGMIGPPNRRATGGGVAMGSPYVVGEEGPELFVPSTSGQILNKQQILNSFHIVDTESNIARRVSEHLMRSLMGGRRFSA